MAALTNVDINKLNKFLSLHLLQNQWLPTAYPPQSFRAPPNAYLSPQSPDINIPLNTLHGSPPTKRPETKSVASQTVGLFFPSQRKIEQLEKEVEDKTTFEKQMRDRRPLLTAVSPGKGERMLAVSSPMVCAKLGIILILNKMMKDCNVLFAVFDSVTDPYPNSS